MPEMKEERIINHFLRSISILSHLTNNSINRIQTNLIKKTFVKGEIIIEEGQSLDYIYLIYEGDFTINKRIEVLFQFDQFEQRKETKKVGVVQISKSQIFGSYEVLKSSPSEYSLVACNDQCVAYLIPKQDVFQIITHEEAHLSRVDKISCAWNQFLSDLIVKAKNLILSKKQFLLQNKLQIKESQKIKKIHEAKPFERFLPEINVSTPKNQKISQMQDISSVRHTVNELLPSRIKNVKSMVNLQKKSDIYSNEYYQRTNDTERARLDSVHYDKQIVNFNLLNTLNLVYNKVEIFQYSKKDEEIVQQPRVYKNELNKKIENTKKNTLEDNYLSSQSERSSPKNKHENYFKQIDKRLNALKNKYNRKSNITSLVSLDSLKNLESTNDINLSFSQINSPVNFPTGTKSSSYLTPKSNKQTIFSRFSNFGSQSLIQNTQPSLPTSTPL